MTDRSVGLDVYPVLDSFLFERGTKQTKNKEALTIYTHHTNESEHGLICSTQITSGLSTQTTYKKSV